jgi:hypothetical protein
MRFSRPTVFFVAALFLNTPTVFSAEEIQPASEADAKAKFEITFAAAKSAVIEKKWDLAQQTLEKAIKDLGGFPHADKAVAQVLLEKAKTQLRNVELLHTADELLKLKQWAEAEAAYRKAGEIIGETDAVTKGIAAAQLGRQAEIAPAKPEIVPAKSAPKIEAAKEPAPLDLQEPSKLNRDEWLKGAGSSCFWEADRLHLEEGDEYYRKPLTKDFSASIAIEAQMDHRSLIRLELRPLKDSGSKSKIIGWGSKEGSAPFLAVERDVKATGDARPPAEQITLSFIRTGAKIEFYCNGKLIGNTWDAKASQPYILWVCGKGIMNGAKVVERE